MTDFETIHKKVERLELENGRLRVLLRAARKLIDPIEQYKLADAIDFDLADSH